MAKRWKIKFNGCELSEDDVTPLDVAVVSKLAELDEWSVLDPRSSPTVLISWVTLAVSRGVNCPVDEAMLLVNQSSMMEVLRSVDVVDVDEGKAPDESGDDPRKRRETMQRLIEARARQVANSEG